MKNVLVFAPHPDDEILGCGGTMLKHIKNGDNVFVCIVTHGEPPLYPLDANVLMQNTVRECHKWMGVKETFFLNFPTTMLEKVDRYQINDAVHKVIVQTNANVVYVPHFGDMQKDHQIVVDSCMVALRPKYDSKVESIYGYETLSETAWNIPAVQNEFIPNAFFDISDFLDGKIKAMSFYESQVGEFPNARSYGAIEALAKYRGALMNMKAAEAFMVLRLLW